MPPVHIQTTRGATRDFPSWDAALTRLLYILSLDDAASIHVRVNIAGIAIELRRA